MIPRGGLRAASRPALIPRTMARTTLMEAAEARLLPHPVEDAYGLLAVEPSGGRPFRLRVVGASWPTRIALAYEASWLEGEGEWTLRRRHTGALVGYRAHVRSDRWLAALAGRALDLSTMHARQVREVLGALESEAARRRSGSRR